MHLSRLRRANKAGVAEFFDVSVNTVTAWLRKGCPTISRGEVGSSWEFDLLAVAEWRFLGQRSGEELDPDTLNPQDRKAWYESEQRRRALQIQDRELIPTDELERVISTAFSAIVQGLRSLPDNIERRTGCSAEILEAIERAIDAETEALAEKLSVLGPVDGG